MKKKSFWVHFLEKGLFAPFFFSIQPIIQLYSINAEELAYQDVIRPVLVSLIIGAISLGIAFWVMRDSVQASLVASLFLLFFYSFGDLSDILQENLTMGFVRLNFSILAIMFIMIALWAFYVHKQGKKSKPIHLFFNLASIFLLIGVLYPLGKNLAERALGEFKIEKTPVIKTEETLPDIYYIILDAYGREDILEEFYGLDNSEFIKELEDEGFYVAKNSNSNYIQTLLSLSSTFNMNYIQELDIKGYEIEGRQDLIELLHHSKVRSILAEKGYEMISFENGYKAAVPDAEIFYNEKKISAPVTSFESIILEHTMVRVLYPWKKPKDFIVGMAYKTHRDMILSIFKRLQKIPELDGNYFVYAHIISPHPPFIFDENGNFISHRETFSLFDANYYIKTHSRENYISGYSKQVVYINKLVLETIREILARSETKPIIIIQGDHGPGAYLHWDSLEKTIPEERLSILNAYYFPDGNYDSLYPSISPINSFSVLLNYLFDSNYHLLPDKHYYSKWMFPLDFVEIPLQ